MNYGLNSSLIQKMNVQLVFNLLRKHKTSTRIELAKMTGLTRSTISNIVNSLISINLLYEYPMDSSGVGRRTIGLGINYDRFHVIHLRITNKQFAIGRYNLKGDQFNYFSKDYNSLFEPKEVMIQIKSKIRNLLDEGEEKAILGIGISLPGPYNSGKYLSLIGELQNWDDIDICREIENEFNIPVYAENDANIGALNEWWLDDTIKDNDTLVYITTAEGTGSGIVINGNLLRGSQGIAGEIGHMAININGDRCKCGNRGCLELYTSTTAILEKAHELSALRQDTILNEYSSKSDFFAAVNSDDPLANEIYIEALRYLGIGVTNIIYLYNPSIIIFGDEMVTYGAGEKLLKTIKKHVKEHINEELYNNITMKLSTSKIDSALLGAGILVINNISEILFNKNILS
ncbi:ROK family transcriptional regulator [Paratissierella segnis]|jgi:predicted NBD/HSP70 family sugar kinase|uniref:ROK family protein n=1 Tax=Paratissierella segnis TaxID=2763679 RepID=A0A926IJR7_9FIRM|nr:ROK family transcriptional regulator [Paratissierella segnis]MBC8586948.1 ROK family protein [Paratissierella segnis]